MKSRKAIIITGKYRGQKIVASSFPKTQYCITDIKKFTSKKKEYFYKTHISNLKFT